MLYVVRGHPQIFISSRKLIREGELEIVKVDGEGVGCKAQYAHLFNDALIYSKRDMTGMFKMTKAIDLAGTTVSTFSVAGKLF